MHDIWRFQHFLGVVDAGSFHGAARAMNISQPALTKSIRLLEEAFGTELFLRLPRGVLPDALLVPEEAVVRNGAGEAQLVVVTADGRAERRNVDLGDAIGGRLVVTAGLKASEMIVIRGQDRVQDGMRVRPASAPQDAATAADRL